MGPRGDKLPLTHKPFFWPALVFFLMEDILLILSFYVLDYVLKHSTFFSFDVFTFFLLVFTVKVTL